MMMAAAEDPDADPDPAKLPFPLQQCEVLSSKGQTFRVSCSICGYKGSATLPKLIYGHFLGDRKMEIRSCISRAAMQENYPDFYGELLEREDKREAKRRWRCWCV